MRYTILLVPASDGFAASAPALPGCSAHGRDRAEALAASDEAMRRWLEVEGFHGRQPLDETRELILDAIRRTMEASDAARAGGGRSVGYDLELVSIEVSPVALA